MSKTASSKSEKITPELLPVDVSGSIHYVKRAEYAKRIAEDQSILLKSSIKKDDVTKLLEFLDNGKTEIPADNPEEYQKTFEVVKADYASAVEQVRADQAAEQKKKDDELKAAEDKKNNEKQLFLAVKDKPAEIGALSDLFDMTDLNRCIPKKELSNEQVLQALNTGLGMSEFSGWMIGDLGVELEKRGFNSVIAELAEARGYKYSTVALNIKTSRQFLPADRVKGVSQTIYRELGTAKFTKEQEPAKKKLLEDIKQGKHTTQTVREAVKAAQGKTKPESVLPEDSDTHVFIIVDPHADDIHKNMVNTCVGFPKELYPGEGIFVINPNTKKFFTGFTKKAENRWQSLEEYVKPQSESEKVAAAIKTKGKGKKGKK